MLKHKLYIIFLLSVILFSCAKNDGENAQRGAVSLTFSERDENLIVKATPRIYKVTILNSKNEIVYSVADNTTIEPEIWLFVGDYTIKAQYGAEKEAAFDAPYYYGEKKIKVVVGKKLDVNVETVLQSVKFSVEYGAELDKYFSTYSTVVSNTVLSGTAKKLTFNKGNVLPAYFKENPESRTMKWNAEFMAFGGQPFILEGTIPAAKANDHYIIKFKLEEGGYESGGVRVVAIVVNENTSSQGDTNIDLGVKRFPEANGVGFDIDQVKNISATDDQSLAVEFAGFPTIRSIVVTYKCDYLSNITNVLTSFDLVAALANPTILADLREDMSLDVSFANKIENCTNAIKFDLKRLVEKITPSADATNSFTFQITDTDNKMTTKTLTFNKINSDIETLQPKKWDIWAARVTVSGRWKKTKPGSMAFNIWSGNGVKTEIAVDPTDVNDAEKTFKVVIPNLLPSTIYRVQALGKTSGKNDLANVITIQTESAPQLINGSFDRWSQGAKNSWYPRTDASEAFWDSGNLGANTLSSVNPTEPEYNDVKDGAAAAKMTSRYVVVKFAAGNLYSGRFKALNGTTPDMEFGQRFSARPSKLTGWYKYKSTTINKEGDKKGLMGKPDRFHIWMMITTAKNMPRPHNGSGSPFDLDAIASTGSDRNVTALCFGEFHNEKIENGVDKTPATNMSAYEQFTIDLKYFPKNLSLEPQFIVVVMSASKYGDYFTGGVDAQLLVDKLELVYE